MKINFDPVFKIQREGFGNIDYQTPGLPPGSIAFFGANNGASLSTISPGTVVLGQNVGQAGAPAKLLSAREIPFNNFSLLMSGIGQSAGQHLIFQYNAAAPANGEPFFEFRNGAGALMASLVVGSSAGNTSCMTFGNGNGVPGNRNVYIIGDASLGNPGTLRDSILIGGNVLATAPAGANQKIVVVGGDSLDTQGAFGSNIAIFGADNFDGLNTDPIGNNITCIGSFNMNAPFPGGLGSSIIMIGTGIDSGAGAANIIMIGDGLQSTLSNICMVGVASQNIILAAALVGQTDNGSKLQVPGSISLPLVVTAVSVTLNNLSHSVIFTASGTATLPTAASSVNRIYVLAAQGAAVITTSIAYTNLAGASVTTVPAGTSVMIQSNGTTWFQIK